MAFDFGGVSTSMKAKSISQKQLDYILVDNFDPTDGDSDYYLFLVEGVPNKNMLTQLQKDIDSRGYNQYIIASATTTKFVKDDVKRPMEQMTQFQSAWRNLIVHRGQRAAAIMSFGFAIYSINKSPDILPLCFYDKQFDKTYYYLGDKFCGDINTFIFPVDGLEQLYPVMESPTIPSTNWKTRFFYNQLVDMKGKKEYPLDMRDYKIIVATDGVNPAPGTRMIQHLTTDILDKLMNADLLAWDLETSGVDWTDDEIGCITLCADGETGYYIPWKIIQTNPELQEKLLNVFYSCTAMVGANIKFDILHVWHWLPQMDIRKFKKIEDTQQLSHAINSGRFKGLKPMSYFYTPFGGYDNELDIFLAQTKCKVFTKVPQNILSKYATMDAIVTWRAFKGLWAHATYIDEHFPNEKPMPDWDIRRWYTDIMQSVYADFCEVEHRGFNINTQYQAGVRKMLQDKIVEVRKELAAAWNVDENFEFGSTTKLGALIKSMGWPAVELSKRGDYATSDDCLSEWERQNRPGLKWLRLFREYTSFLSSFIGIPGPTRAQSTGWEQYKVLEPDGQWKIHHQYKIMGTETYRCIGVNPNLQNVPTHSKMSAEIKRCIHPPHSWEYELESESGQLYQGGANDTIEVVGRGRITFDKITENDTIIDGTHIPYVPKYDDLMET